MHKRSLVSVKVEPGSTSRLSSALFILPLLYLRDHNFRALMCVAKNASVDSNLQSSLCVWGSRNGPVVRTLLSHQCGLSSVPGVGSVPRVGFVVVSLLCFERFFSGYSGFPLSSKTNIFKFKFDQESGTRRIILWMCYLKIIIYLFISIAAL